MVLELLIQIQLEQWARQPAQMKTLSTFTSAGWDFVNVWGINSGHTYPYLLTKGPPR